MRMIRAVLGSTERTVATTAAATTYGGCGVTEVALVVGSSVTGYKRFQVAHQLEELGDIISQRKLAAHPGTQATASITVGTTVENDTVTIDGTALTLKAAGNYTDPTTQILIGASAGATAANLAATIKRNTTINTKITAAVNGSTPTQVDLTSLLGNVGQNALTLAQSATSFTLSGGTFSGGASFVNEYWLTANQVAARYTLTKRAIATAPVETHFGIVIGDTAHRHLLARTGAFEAALRACIENYKRTVLNKA